LKIIDTNEFKDPFYIYYCDGELAITEIAKEIWATSDGDVFLKVTNIEGVQDVIELDESFEAYNVSSLIDILEHLKKGMKEEMTLSLIKRINCDGSQKKCFTTKLDGKEERFTLETLINGDIEFVFGGKHMEKMFVSDMTFEMLADVYERVSKETTWNVRLQGYIDRRYHVNAATWEEAVEEAGRRFHNESVSRDEITFQASEYD